MSKLSKGSSGDHHHQCPHFVDIHKQQPKVEPRREIVKGDLIDHQQQLQPQHLGGHSSGATCVHLTGQAQLEQSEKGTKSDQTSPRSGTKAVDVSENPPKSTSVR